MLLFLKVRNNKFILVHSKFLLSRFLVDCRLYWPNGKNCGLSKKVCRVSILMAAYLGVLVGCGYMRALTVEIQKRAVKRPPIFVFIILLYMLQRSNYTRVFRPCRAFLALSASTRRRARGRMRRPLWGCRQPRSDAACRPP